MRKLLKSLQKKRRQRNRIPFKIKQYEHAAFADRLAANAVFLLRTVVHMPEYVRIGVIKEQIGDRFMKKKEQFEAIVEKTSYPDTGILHIEDRTVKVKHALEGQKIRLSISKLRQGKAEARLLEVVEPAANEITPLCPHFANCGGCSYQNLAYKDQLKLKEKQIKELLDTVVPDGSYEYEPIHGSPSCEDYRNKMEFTFGDEYMNGPLALGLHKSGSFYDILPVTECRIMDSDFRLIMKTTLEYFREREISYYHRMRHTGYLRHLLVRKAYYTGEILVDLVTTRDDSDEELIGGWLKTLLKLEEAGKISGKLAGILHTHNDSVADMIKDEGTDVLYGDIYIHEKLLGLDFKISPFSFFQTNSRGAEVLYETARSYVGDTKDMKVFDLYSGTGTIAQLLASVADKVVGIEIVEEAVEAAKKNAVLNGLSNCEFIAGDVLKKLDEITDKPDIIVVDPPRDGVHPKALDKIINYGVQNIIYISCKPTSLVRDLEILQEKGYKVVKATAVDQFPNTAHVETVVLMSKTDLRLL